MVITAQHETHTEPKTSGMVFRPPQPDPLFQRFIRFFLPLIFRHALNGFSVQVDSASLERLRAIQDQRCLLLPNHPSQWDPWAMVEISRRLHENFFYLAAREVFDFHYGLQGWVFQRMGCYSVVRGASDKESFKTTREILSRNKGRLVIFVEGEISNQNDSLLPLEPGVLQLAFLSLQDLYKKAQKDLAQLPSLFVCPVAIKYFYDPHGLEKTIEKSIQSLERAVGLNAGDNSLYERIRSIGTRVLEETAKQFGYPLSLEDSLYDQIRGLEHFMLTKMEQVLNLPDEPQLGYLDRVRRIRNRVDKVIKEIPEDQTAYQSRLHTHQKAVLKNFYWDLDRIVNFIAIYDGYIHPEMTPERCVEVLRRLEREVFGVYHLTHPRTAVLQVLEPIDLKDRFEAFLQDKKKTSEELIHEIEGGLYQAIIATQSLQAASV